MAKIKVEKQKKKLFTTHITNIQEAQNPVKKSMKINQKKKEKPVWQPKALRNQDSCPCRLCQKRHNQSTRLCAIGWEGPFWEAEKKWVWRREWICECKNWSCRLGLEECWGRDCWFLRPYGTPAIDELIQRDLAFAITSGNKWLSE